MKAKLALIGLVTTTILMSSCQNNDVINNDNSSVYYEIFVGSFYDTDGDGYGDFDGVSQKLDYLQQLGVGGLWLMPIHPSPTYHKYDVTDYYLTAPEYGTMAQFENMISEADKRNIDVIIDLVINHTSDSHPWFQEAINLYKNNDCDEPDSVCHYYNFSNTNKQGYSSKHNFYYEAQFWSGMPDLNLDNPYLKQEISDIVEFWINKGVKGFRLDAVTSYYTNSQNKTIEFLSWLNGMVKEHLPSAYIVAEGPWADYTDQLVPYYQSGIDSYFNFPVSVQNPRLYTNIRQSKGSTLANFFAESNRKLKDVNEDLIDAPFLSNHDQNRVAGLLFPTNTLQSRKLMGTLYLLLPGRPFIYYGEEIEMRGSGIDPNKRLPMIWSQKDKTGQTNLPTGAIYDMDLQVKLGVNDQLKNQNSLLNHYKKVINIRNAYNDYIEYARISAIDSQPQIMGLNYVSNAGELIILTNVCDEMVQQTIAGNYQMVENIMVDKVKSKTTHQGENTLVSVAPFSTVFLQVI